jgi:hypothetical protein
LVISALSGRVTVANVAAFQSGCAATPAKM